MDGDVMIFSPVNPTLFFSRNDVNDPRLGDMAKALPPLDNAETLAANLSDDAKSFPGTRRFVIAGYQDDEGIRINGGRAGAAEAPDRIRRPLYKMTPQLLARERDFVLWDAGNLEGANVPLSERHRLAEEFSLAALRAGASWISLGGGHDYGFADAASYISWSKSMGHRPLVINFDAHLDVRPTDRGLSSGTPFYRMFEREAEVDFAEIGIQGQCNSLAHFNWLKEKGARILTMEEIESSGEDFQVMALKTLGDWILRPRPAFISIDIDGFSSAVAPGASQSWATGFMPCDFFPLFQVLVRRLDVRLLGIYETSPPLDHDDRTAKLAAQIAHRFINSI
jgi:formiminoglutamase